MRKNLVLAWEGRPIRGGQRPLSRVVIPVGSNRGGHYFVPNLLFLFEGTYEIRCLRGFGWRRDKDPKFGHDTAVSEGELVGHVNDIAAYAVSHDRPYILGWRTTSMSVLE